MLNPTPDDDTNYTVCAKPHSWWWQLALADTGQSYNSILAVLSLIHNCGLDIKLEASRQVLGTHFDMLGLCHNTLTPARTPRIGLCHNTLTPARTPRFGLCHNTLTPASTHRLGLFHNTLTPASTPRLALCHNTLTLARTHRLGLCHSTMTPARTHRLELCHNTLTPARTHRLELCHSTLTPARTHRLELCHNTLTPARTHRLRLCQYLWRRPCMHGNCVPNAIYLFRTSSPLHSFPATLLFCRHPSVLNTILPNKVRWSALFLLPGRSRLAPTPCFCLSFYLCQFF